MGLNNTYYNDVWLCLRLTSSRKALVINIDYIRTYGMNNIMVICLEFLMIYRQQLLLKKTQLHNH